MSFAADPRTDPKEALQRLGQLQEALRQTQEELKARTCELAHAHQALQAEVAQRTRAAEARQAAEQSYRHLFESANDLVFTADLNLLVTSVNRAGERISGYRRKELLGKPATEFVAPEAVDEIHRMFKAKLGGLESTTYELPILTKDGRQPVLEFSTCLLFHEGRPVGVQGIARDVSARRQVEEELRLTQFAVDRAMEAVFRSGPDARFEYVNEAACRSLGYTRDELLAMTVHDVNVDLPAEQWPERMRALRQEGPLRYEARYRRKDGTVFPVEITAHQVDFAGRQCNWAFVRDTSDRERAAEVLRDSEAALQRSSEQLRALAASLFRAQEEERRRLSRELHDDLSQRLAMLAVEAEAVEQKLPPAHDSIRAWLQALRKEVVALSDDLRRLAYQLHPSIIEHLGLGVALKSYCAEFARRHGMRVKFICRDRPAGVSQDVALCLYRATQEGLRNVVKHSQSPRATVVLSGGRQGLHLSVTDFGVGFDTGSIDAKGGLGIISMEERVRLVGGSLAVRSRPGGGTRLDVRIPLPAEAT